MKLTILLPVFLLLSLVTKAQYPQKLAGPVTQYYTHIWKNMGVPDDTLTPPVAVRTKPHLAFKGNTLYKWDTAGLRWGVFSASASLSSLTASTGTNTINNANYPQIWQWNTLNGDAFRVTSSSNSANTLSRLFSIDFTGTNGTGTATRSAEIINARSGTASTNYAVFGSALNGTSNFAGYFQAVGSGSTTNTAGHFRAANGTNNYGLIVEEGKTGIGTTSPDSLLHVAGSVHATGRIRFSGLNTGIPSGAKRLLVGTDGTMYAADTTAGGGGGLSKTTKSVTVASDSIQLVNDSTTLTGSKVYGTDSTGVRGWQPALKTVLTSPTAGEILIFRDANTLVNAANAGASIGVLQFKVGDTDAPANGDSVFTHTGFIDKYLAVYREGLRQYYNVSANGVEVNTASGTVTFHPVLTTGEEIVIERRNFESVEQMELETSTFSHTITDYSGAGAAYSLMKLSSGYSGYAVTVRRSSDNTTQDIGFVNNYLDTAAMKSFVGANNGFISKWYDQSGNARDLAQTTNSLQPQIIASGVVYYKSGRPSVYFGGTQYLFKTGFTVNQPDTWFVVGEIGTTANRGFFDGGSSRQILGINGTTVNFAGSFGNYGSSVNTFSVFYTLFDGASSKIAVNGNAGVTVSSGSNALTDLYMGYWSGGGGMTGYISELILYPSNQSANKAGIETSINSRYSIF